MDSSSWWALLLDLDGTLIHTDSLHQSLWGEILASYGIFLTKEEYCQRIAGRSDEEIWKEWGVGTREEQQHWNEWKEQSFLMRIQETVPIRGGRELVHDWICAGQWVGVVTNSCSKIANALIQRLQINDIDVLITSDSGCAPKPSPEPYQKALYELGIPSERCMIVEDSDIGIQSAKQIKPERLFRMTAPSLSHSSASSFLDTLSKHGEIPISDFYDDLLKPPSLDHHLFQFHHHNYHQK